MRMLNAFGSRPVMMKGLMMSKQMNYEPKSYSLMGNMMNRKCKKAMAPKRMEKKERGMEFVMGLDKMEMDNVKLSKMEVCAPSNINKDIKKINNDKGNDLNKLIMSQDIIQGFWDENENSLLIKNMMNEKFCKIENFVNAEKEIKDKKKVIFTILVLYYLLNDMKDKLDELRLIINKGKKYLNSINYPYDDILQKVGL